MTATTRVAVAKCLLVVRAVVGRHSRRQLRDKADRLQVVEGMLIDIDDRKQMEEKLQLANTLLTTEMETRIRDAAAAAAPRFGHANSGDRCGTGAASMSER